MYRSEFTRLYHGFAQGQAIRRNRRMREARRLRDDARRLEAGAVRPFELGLEARRLIGPELMFSDSEFAARLLRGIVENRVKAARRAHREWRHYRKQYLASLAEDRALA